MDTPDWRPSRIVLDLYQAALAAADGERATAGYLQENRWQADRPLALFACGKAADAMARGAATVLGARIDRAMLVSKRGYLPPDCPHQWQCLAAGHPVPDARSLEAGQGLLHWIQELPPDMPLLILISGGTSALLEYLPPGVSLADLQRANTWLLGSGLEIGDMNRVRKRLSCLKGGKLTAYLGGRPVLSLLISDVPGDDPAVIGSGLLTPPAGSDSLPPDLPAWLVALTRLEANCPPPVDSNPAIEQYIIATNRDACEAAAAQARRYALPVHLHPPLFAPVAEVTTQLAGFLRIAPAGVHIWGGEPTVKLPAAPGRGGRNQHLALSLALALEGVDGVTVLCGASDGGDGPGDDAGAVIDGSTLGRASDYPGGARQALRQADSGGFLAEAGALVSTGPTGTNVMDLVIAIKSGASR